MDLSDWPSFFLDLYFSPAVEGTTGQTKFKQGKSPTFVYFSGFLAGGCCAGVSRVF